MPHEAWVSNLCMFLATGYCLVKMEIIDMPTDEEIFLDQLPETYVRSTEDIVRQAQSWTARQLFKRLQGSVSLNEENGLMLQSLSTFLPFLEVFTGEKLEMESRLMDVYPLFEKLRAQVGGPNSGKYKTAMEVLGATLGDQNKTVDNVVKRAVVVLGHRVSWPKLADLFSYLEALALDFVQKGRPDYVTCICLIAGKIVKKYALPLFQPAGFKDLVDYLEEYESQGLLHKDRAIGRALVLQKDILEETMHIVRFLGIATRYCARSVAEEVCCRIFKMTNFN